MASAGHAHAHSSQPMHFSSPSGQRLSWCRPWNRGAVAFFSNGYSSVTTFLNIVRKVTPKPAMGSQNWVLASATDGLPTDARVVGRFGHRWHRVTAGEGVELVRLGALLRVVRGLADEPEHQEH